MTTTKRNLLLATLLLAFTMRGYAFSPQEQFKQMREQMKARIDRMFDDDFFSDSGFPDTAFADMGKMGGFAGFGNQGMSISVKDDADYQYYTLAGKGLDPEKLDIKIKDNRVTISSNQKSDEEKKDDNESFHSQTAFSFTQSFGIPETLDASKVEILQEDGKTVLKFPKIGIKGGAINKKENII